MQINAFSAGLSGIQYGQQRVDRAAGDIARTPLDEQNADPTTSLVDLEVGKQQVQANVRTVETADEVLGSLLDIRA